LAKLTDRAKSGLVKASFRFERLFPRLVKLYLGRQLKKYKKKGTISDYALKARRIGKYHYYFQVDLFVGTRKEVIT
jgi:hypothetical protein